MTGEYAEPADLRPEDAGTSNQEASVIAAYDITITNGEEEYQPTERHPIRVEITDPQISAADLTELWHVKDNGERERMTDITVENGKICFYAVGFSVYAIVTAPDPHEQSDLEPVTSLADLTGSRAGSGFYLYYTQ